MELYHMFQNFIGLLVDVGKILSGFREYCRTRHVKICFRTPKIHEKSVNFPKFDLVGTWYVLSEFDPTSPWGSNFIPKFLRPSTVSRTSHVA